MTQPERRRTTWSTGSRSRYRIALHRRGRPAARGRRRRLLLLRQRGRRRRRREPASTAVTTARFNAHRGHVKVKPVGTFEWVTADRAMVLRKSDLVRTGPGAAAEITFFDGTVFHVRPDSLITIEETSRGPAVAQAAQRGLAHLVGRGELPDRAPATCRQRDRDLDAHGAHHRRPRDGRAASRWPRVGRQRRAHLPGHGAGRRPRAASASRSAPNQGVKVDAGGAGRARP